MVPAVLRSPALLRFHEAERGQNLTIELQLENNAIYTHSQWHLRISAFMQCKLHALTTVRHHFIMKREISILDRLSHTVNILGSKLGLLLDFFPHCLSCVFGRLFPAMTVENPYEGLFSEFGNFFEIVIRLQLYGEIVPP